MCLCECVFEQAKDLTATLLDNLSPVLAVMMALSALCVFVGNPCVTVWNYMYLYFLYLCSDAYADVFVCLSVCICLFMAQQTVDY